MAQRLLRPVQDAAQECEAKSNRQNIAVGNDAWQIAHEQGYRGDQLLPTFSFTPKTKRVRPAFELFEYRRLLRTLIKWQRDCPNNTWLHARRLLTDYVLVLANSGMRIRAIARRQIPPRSLRILLGCDDRIARFHIAAHYLRKAIIVETDHNRYSRRQIVAKNPDLRLGRHLAHAARHIVQRRVWYPDHIVTLVGNDLRV